MLLSVSAEAGHRCNNGGSRFFPGDTVRGTVRLKTSKPLDIDSVSVTLLGEQEGKLVAHGTDSGWINAKLLETKTELHSRDRYAGAPPLAAGTYAWPFSFAFPELPQDWSTQKLQSRYPASFLFIDGGRRSIVFTRYVVLASVKGSGISQQAEDKLIFWPTRRTNLEQGPLPKIRDSLLHYSIPYPEASKLKRLIPGFKRHEDIAIAAKLYIPRLHVIGNSLPLQIELELRSGQDHPMFESTKMCQITATRLQLMAITKVGQQDPMTVDSVNLIMERAFKNLALVVPLSGVRDTTAQPQRINIHDALPQPGYLIHCDPYERMTPDIAGRSTSGPIVPTFEAPLCSRTYHLKLSLTIACAGQNKMLDVRSEEVVLLPDELDQTLKQPEVPAQLDAAQEIGRVEAAHGEVVEMAGDSRRFAEMHGVSTRLELAGNPADLPSRLNAAPAELPDSST